ncbi:MAG: hypothetical protein HGA60_02140 [Chlorobiaceae bacterium]|nr:hypothetical protein [Chlorobiaceae bacterium]
MKFISLLAAILLMILPASSTPRISERMIEPEGHTDTYRSDNGVYEVTITWHSPFASWSLKERGRELWSQPLMAEGGAAAVSDNGAVITQPLWGWRDEGGSSGIAVYDGQGQLKSKIMFKSDDGREGLRWVDSTVISPDGSCIVIGEGHRENASITMFSVSDGRLLWQTNAGYPRVAAIRTSARGTFTLLATSQERNQDMEFVLFDRNGKVIWTELKTDNFSWDASPYVRFVPDGKGFEIYDLKAGHYDKRSFPVVSGSR